VLMKGKLFDTWPEKYDEWFTTPTGSIVKMYEADLIQDLLRPESGDFILDAGCGTGVFTLDMLSSGAHVMGMDISMPMLKRAREKTREYRFRMGLGDLRALPFADESFDKAVSITALEFIMDAKRAVSELFRVTRKGGCIVVATLNSLSTWAKQRKIEAMEKHTVFESVVFRSPDELRSLAPVEGIVKTAIHFQKHDDPDIAHAVEIDGYNKASDTGAFLAVRWEKP